MVELKENAINILVGIKAFEISAFIKDHIYAKNVNKIIDRFSGLTSANKP